MKFKKIAVTFAAVLTLVVGSQSAFANTNVYELQNTTNNSFSTPEKFPDPGYQLTMVGTLSSTSDNDWFIWTPPANTIGPGSNAMITLISPTGQQYELSICTEDGGFVQKDWLSTSGQVIQSKIYTQANTKYKLHVFTNGSTVSANNYMLSIN